MFKGYYYKIVIAVTAIVLLAFLVSWLLITRFSFTLAVVGLVIILLISLFIIRLTTRLNRQILFFFEAVRHHDFTNQYPAVPGDPVLDGLYAEMNRITCLFSEKELMTRENRNYYEGLLQVMAHEIRNSVTPVTSLAEDMERHYDTYGPVIVKEGWNIVYSQGKTLLNLLDAYHRLTHLPEPVSLEFSLPDLFEKLKRLLETETSKEITCEINGVEKIKGDPHLLLLALLHLVRNALQGISDKPEGRVRISAGYEINRVVIEIIDNGVGIPASLQKQIFTPYYSTKSEGSGVGLSISQRIVHLHGGELTVESFPDIKTSFFIALPC